MHVYEAASILAEIIVAHGIRYAVICPGSRSAPLALALVRQSSLQHYVVHDERSAAYQALGMAQQLQQPVALVCTSGTAALNFAPAIAEAHYLHIPLLVLTADRPPEWIDQQDGQTLHQHRMFEPYTKASLQLPASYQHPDEHWHLNRVANEACLLLRQAPYAPVHLNCPFREPLYPDTDRQARHHPAESKTKRIIEALFTNHTHTLNPTQWQWLHKHWKEAQRPAIVIGQLHASPSLYKQIKTCSDTLQIPVICGHLANYPYPNDGLRYPHLLTPPLLPDLIISLGGSHLSKSFKQQLRQFPPKQHWHIQPHAGLSADPFQSLTAVLHIQAEDFFRQACEQLTPAQPQYKQQLLQLQQLYHDYLNQSPLLQTNSPALWHELWLTYHTLAQLPQNTHLHVSNSSPVRYLEMLPMPTEKNIKVYANRGTSGIDGCSSTAAGAARVAKESVVLLTGDIAFFYDSNAFWELPKTLNFKVLVINNKGGGIFRLIEGPTQQPEGEPLFETPHQRSAGSFSQHMGINYYHTDSPALFQKELSAFFYRPGMAIFEAIVDRRHNAHLFKQFNQAWKDYRLAAGLFSSS